MRARNFLLAPLELGILIAGVFVYWITRRTPSISYLAMIRLYCRTRGRSNDALAWFVSHLTRDSARKSAPTENPIPQLLERGYFIFQRRVPEPTVERLLNFALTHPGVPRLGRKMPPSVYHRTRPLAPRHDFSEEDLLALPDVQSLVTDPEFLAHAQEYLRASPVLTSVGMWWSSAVECDEGLRIEAAQQYHFDMDRIRWVKFFVYLSDVNDSSGPHCFVSGSHRTGDPPDDLLRRGYSRIPDEDLLRHYPGERIVEVVGPRGTLFAADTRAFHKGKPARQGDRLVFQIEYANSLFGGAWHKLPLSHQRHGDLIRQSALWPRLLTRFNITE